jgi:hypothetical protein
VFVTEQELIRKENCHAVTDYHTLLCLRYLPQRERTLRPSTGAEDQGQVITTAWVAAWFFTANLRLTRRIAAVTEAGFESKIFATFVAYAILGVAS